MAKRQADERNFADDSQINKFKLDEECVRHSGNYHYYAEALAQARAETDAAEDTLKLTLSETLLEVRQQLDNGGVKYTEAVVNANIECDAGVLAAREALRSARATQYRLEAGVKAMEHRKAQLDNLVQLHIRSYYATPAEGGIPREAVQADAGREARRNLNRNRQNDGE